MRVAINLVEFNPGKMGGIETYVFNLLKRLLSDEGSNSFTVICSESNADYFSWIHHPVNLKVIGNRRKSFERLFRSLLRKTTGMNLLAMGIDRMGMDVVHNPLTNIRPMSLTTPSVLTFHDMQHEYYPEMFSRRELLRRKMKYGKGAQCATRIIAISRHAKRCLMERFSIDPEKIDVVYQGCGPEYRPLGGDPRLDAIREKYNLSRPVLYYPAALWPHKNHKNLLAALDILRERHRFDGRLVLTGIAMPGSAEVLAEIARLRLDDMVRVLGHVPAEELPYLYNLARVMVFPSLFEGFGIPLVEAMACGCPVVCSGSASIPEVAGDAGLICDPLSPGDMAEKIRSVWTNGEVLTGMREKGILRARTFTWHETARKTLGVYRRAADDCRRRALSGETC